MLCLKIVRIVLKKNRLFPNTHCLKHWKFIKTLLRNPQKQKNRRAKPLKPPRKFKILSFRGVFLKNLGFL
nr:hypothetical protein [Helicobacter pylori]